VWVPLRHVGWAASLSATGLTLSESIRHPLTRSIEVGILHLHRARFISAVGWALGGAEALRSAQGAWLDHPAWQGLRRYTEDALALSDPSERAFALSVMLDGLLWPQLGGDALRRFGGDEAVMLAEYLDALIEPSTTDHPIRVNTATLAEWATRAASASLPVIEQVWGRETDQRLGAAMEKLAVWVLPDGEALAMRHA
jgi:phenol/toluene 2-monooxygenase (NADH) P1/A1